MSGSINKVILIGYLGRDPEVRYTPNDCKIVTLSVATAEVWKDKATGERREKTEWHRTVIYNDKLADIADKYLQKGSRLYVEGQLQTRKWTNASGREQYLTEIILSSYKGNLTLLDSKSAAPVDLPPHPVDDDNHDSIPSASENEDELSQSECSLSHQSDSPSLDT